MGSIQHTKTSQRSQAATTCGMVVKRHRHGVQKKRRISKAIGGEVNNNPSLNSILHQILSQVLEIHSKIQDGKTCVACVCDAL